MVNDMKETPRAGSEPRPSRFSVGAITPSTRRAWCRSKSWKRSKCKSPYSVFGGENEWNFFFFLLLELLQMSNIQLFHFATMLLVFNTPHFSVQTQTSLDIWQEMARCWREKFPFFKQCSSRPNVPQSNVITEPQHPLILIRGGEKLNMFEIWLIHILGLSVSRLEDTTKAALVFKCVCGTLY